MKAAKDPVIGLNQPPPDRLRKYGFLLTVLLGLFPHLLPSACFSQPWAIRQKIDAAEKQVSDHPGDQAAYEGLYFLLTNHYLQFTIAERTDLRNFLRTHARWPMARICSPEEPGRRITIKGKLTDEKGLPLADAELFIFQTDTRGYYTPNDSLNKSMGESDPRIFGFIRTDQSGNYTLRTIRPASYPILYRGSRVPQHIHFNIQARGFKERRIQLVLKDDPAMTPHWMEWAAKMNFPVVTLDYAGNQAMGINNIVLVK
jgi:hypothetical protein